MQVKEAQTPVICALAKVCKNVLVDGFRREAVLPA